MGLAMSVEYFYSKLLKKLRGRAIRRSAIHSTSKIEAGSEINDSTFGRHSFCGYYCEISNCDVGSFCSIANHVIIGGGRHPMEWISTSPVFYSGRDSVRAKFAEHSRERPARVRIGHDVWVGERAILRQGVSVGVGAVIGMGSVVTRDVPPYTVVAGVPARVIRRRFPDSICERLLASNWWLLDDEKLSDAARFATDPMEFLRYIGA